MACTKFVCLIFLHRSTDREIFLESYLIKLKSDCIYHFPINLEPNGRSFGSKSIGKC